MHLASRAHRSPAGIQNRVGPGYHVKSEAKPGHHHRTPTSSLYKNPEDRSRTLHIPHPSIHMCETA